MSVDTEKEAMEVAQGETQDLWAQWLLNRRYGGDPEQQRTLLNYLYPVRDQILLNARLAEGETLLDVGTGDGLVAFGALEQVGEQGKVLFSDVSQDLLEHSREIAQRMGVADRCRFLLTPAGSISMQNKSVDVVTTRSVLIYVKAKQQAFNEFYRVLKPGGRISLFEPINKYFGYPPQDNTFVGYDITPVAEIARKVQSIYVRIQPETDPMLDFDERDLLTLARNAGFREVHMELQVDVIPGGWHGSWEQLLSMSGNPKIPTLGEAMEQVLTPVEVEQFTAHLRPLVDDKQGRRQEAVAYLWAVKD